MEVHFWKFVGKLIFSKVNSLRILTGLSVVRSFICTCWCIFPGSIIRAFRRLEEALRQLVQATRNIGNNDLEEKFNESIKLLKKGIAFAASLYL